MHSLSKTSNLAGYRAGFVTGDPALVAELLEVRKHAGMIMPLPVQAAMTAALADDAHVGAQRRRYERAARGAAARIGGGGLHRRAFRGGAVPVGHRGEPCRLTVRRLATEGVLVAPGEFYGPAGAQHVRLALTASDERIETAARRLARR